MALGRVPQRRTHPLVQRMQCVTRHTCVVGQPLTAALTDVVVLAQQAMLPRALGHRIGLRTIEIAVRERRLDAVHAVDVAQRAKTVLARALAVQGNADIRKELPCGTSKSIHVDASLSLDASVVQRFPGEVHAVVAHVLVVLAEAEFLRVRAEGLKLLVLLFAYLEGAAVSRVLIDICIIRHDVTGPVDASVYLGCEPETLRGLA
ncbi:hypothetical protein [Stenotrophomonas indicatrix]|uniref:hypothetical protein n=1 Tax=Stenotrophomonas indicatrix TaxID=2045451 RepID=UPI003D8138AD